VFGGLGGTLEINGLIPGGMGNNCLAGEVFDVVINFTFFVIAACIACSGVSTTIKTMIRITLKL
jgi:NADH:ubiquinone oxidoreductase subunit F (NADH-binding)